MSVDVLIACTISASLPSALPSDVTWKRYEHKGHTTFASEHPTWQVLVGQESSEVAKDFDLPAGKPFLVSITLEPIGAPDAGHSLLDRVVGAITKSCDGVVID